MKKVIRIILIVFLALWTMVNLLSILRAFSGSDGLLVVVALFVYLIVAVPIYRLISRLNKKEEPVDIPPIFEVSVKTTYDNPYQQALNDGRVLEGAPADMYIIDGGNISRADGKLPTDEDVAYFIEYGMQRAMQEEQDSPNPLFHRSAQEEELKYQFEDSSKPQTYIKMMSHFTNLRSLAHDKTDSNRKIETLEQALVAFGYARQWHYNHSQGAMLYFQDNWENLHNSRNPCFSWADVVKHEMEEEINLQHIVIPEILEQSIGGFLQKDIYAMFPNESKESLRYVINALVQSDRVTKTKHGNTYFIKRT